MPEPLPHAERVARARTIWAIAIAVVAGVLFSLAAPALWLNRVVFDTEAWVATVAPLAADPAIQDALASTASEAIIEELDATQRLTELLPGPLEQFAPVLASSVENAIRTQATRIVRSDRFPELWADINRKSHAALLAALTGREGTVGIEAGTVTLDTGDIVEVVAAELEERGLGFVSRIPRTGALDRDIVVYQSDTLARLGPTVESIQRLAISIPLAAVLLTAVAFVLAADRRRVALWLGVVVAVGGILPLQMLFLAQYAAVRRVVELAAIPTQAAQSAFDIIFRDLVAADQILVVVGLFVVLGAVVAGPARWATALRSNLSGGVSVAASRFDLGSAATWVAQNKRALRAAGFVLAGIALFLLPAPRTVSEVVWLALGVGLGVLAIEFLGAARKIADETPLDGPPPADGDDSAS